MIKLLLTVFVFVGLIIGSSSIEVWAQNDEAQWRSNFAAEKSREWQQQRAEVLEFAERTGIPVRQELEDGRIIELRRIEDGFPVYYTTHNLGGAQLSSVDAIWPGGDSDISVTGNGETLGIWDGGAVRLSHQEFGGRVTQKDDADTDDPSNHATHVAGTMVAAGIWDEAKGMANLADLDAYDWNDDLSDMASAINEGIRVTNHSYGSITGWNCPSPSSSNCDDDESEPYWRWYGNTSISETEDFRYGYYSGLSESWDDLASKSNRTVIVNSAGNSRLQGPSDQPIQHEIWDPDEGEEGDWVFSEDVRDLDGGPNGYQSLSGRTVAKNILTVGAVDENVSLANFSSRGPTDDGRIKPEIVAKGVSVTSPVASDDEAYGTFNGTSMSAPMVSGTIALLQQHYKELHGTSTAPLASTIKALLFQTADQTGQEGPDYDYGWGLMNAQKAAELLQKDADEEANHKVHEITLNDGQEFEHEILSDGEQPIRATIAWTDPAGEPVDPPELNPTDLMLVNDLDLRIDGPNQTHMPFVLDPDNPSQSATTGDNYRDNAEQVYIDAPESGSHTIRVSHKDNLQGGSQTFSLIIEGMAEESDLIPDQVVLSEPEDEAVEILLQPEFSWEAADAAETYHLQVDDQSNFTSPVIDESGIVDTKYQAASDLDPNTTYYWRVRGVNQHEDGDWSDHFQFSTISGPPAQVSLTFPENNEENISLNPELNWEDTEGAETYRVQLDQDSGFSDPLVDESDLQDTQFEVENELDNLTTYYWRVQATNPEGDGDWSETYAFTTEPDLPEQISLINPENEAIDIDILPEFSWNEAELAETYEIQLADNPEFDDPVLNETEIQDTTFSTVDSLDYEQEYYWQVRGVNPAGSGEWSDPFTFTTRPSLPDPVVLTTPNDEEESVDLQPALKWDPSDGAETYELQLADNPDFEDPLINERELDTTDYQIDFDLLRVTTYYWRVRAANRIGANDWTEFSFTTMLSAPAQVVLLEPENEAEDISLQPELSWHEADGAETYQIRLADNSDFDNLILDETDLEDTTFTLDQELENNESYYWKVRAINENGEGDWSESSSFLTVPEIPDQVTLIAPENEVQDWSTEPIFQWEPAERAYHYQLQVADNDDFDDLFVDVADLDTTQTFSPEILEHETTYFWRVRATNTGGEGEWSTSRSLTTVIQPPETVNLVSPENEAVDVAIDPTLEWEPAERAESYHVQLSGNPDFDNMVANDSTVTESSLSLADSLQEDTTYWWRVKAKNTGGSTNWSDTWSFTTQTITSSEEPADLPEELILKQNYPNPFNPATVIEFVLPESGEVSLKIYDTVGRKVEVLIDGTVEAGQHQVTFEAENLTSGVYIYQLETENAVRTRTFTYLR